MKSELLHLLLDGTIDRCIFNLIQGVTEVAIVTAIKNTLELG